MLHTSAQGQEAQQAAAAHLHQRHNTLSSLPLLLLLHRSGAERCIQQARLPVCPGDRLSLQDQVGPALQGRCRQLCRVRHQACTAERNSQRAQHIHLGAGAAAAGLVNFPLGLYQQRQKRHECRWDSSEDWHLARWLCGPVQ